MFVRFSTVAGSKGSADSVRDIRGFAVRFYTNEGNFDIVGNSVPVFFVQDAIKFVSSALGIFFLEPYARTGICRLLFPHTRLDSTRFDYDAC